MNEYCFGMHLFFWGGGRGGVLAYWGSFSCAFPGMTKAGNFVAHGCDPGSKAAYSKWKMMADKLNPSNDDIYKAEVEYPRWDALQYMLHPIIGLDLKTSAKGK